MKPLPPTGWRMVQESDQADPGMPSNTRRLSVPAVRREGPDADVTPYGGRGPHVTNGQHRRPAARCSWSWRGAFGTFFWRVYGSTGLLRGRAADRRRATRGRASGASRRWCSAQTKMFEQPAIGVAHS